MPDNVLVVAFDGLDKQLIEKYGLENVMQEEFGQIDNQTGVSEVKTGELFASFLTGVGHEEHGISGLKKWNTGLMNIVERMIPKKKGVIRGAAVAVKDVIKCLGFLDREPYSKDDLEVDTLFDTIPDSKALNVPVYTIQHGVFNEVFSWTLDRHRIEFAATEAEKEFGRRKDELLQELQENERTFLMAQFHYPDYMNHLFGDPVRDEERLRSVYKRVDEFAGEVLDAAEGTYGTVLFMSDHGLPTHSEHNDQAFYSLNRDIGLGTPHITDFHDLILEWTGTGEVGGIDV